MTLLVPLLLALAQGSAAPRDHQPVLRFDGVEVPRYAFEDWLSFQRGEVAAPEHVHHRTYLAGARALGLADVRAEAAALAEAEIAERVAKAHDGDASRWLAELERAGRTPEGRRAQRTQELEAEVALRRVAAHGRVVPEEKVLRDWRLLHGPDGRRYQVRLLFRRLPPAPPAASREEADRERERARAELEAELSALRERVAEGEAFAALARELSDDAATRASGGRPPGGDLDPRGWPPAALAMLARLEPGGVSEPIFRQGGAWLVQVEGVVVTPLEDVRAEIEQALIAKGPEPDEVAAATARLSEGVAFEVLPAMWAPPTPGAPLADEPVLRVGADLVARRAYDAWLVRAHGDQLARRFAEDATIERVASEAGIQPTPEEIEARLEREMQATIDEHFRGERARFEAEVVRSRGSLEAWKRDARKQMRVDLLVERLWMRAREVSDEDVQAAWRARYGPRGERVRVRLIRIDVDLPELPEDATREEAQRLAREAIDAARAEAEEVARRATDGEDFAALARRFSDDAASRERGGEPPSGFDPRALPDPVPAEIDALAPGRVSGVLDAGTALYVVELLERVLVPLESAREALAAEIAATPPSPFELRAHLEALTRDLSIEVLPAMFE